MVLHAAGQIFVGGAGKAMCPFSPKFRQSQIRSTHILVVSTHCRTFDVIRHCPIGFSNGHDMPPR